MSYTLKKLDAGMSIGGLGRNHDGMKQKIYCLALRLVQRREWLESTWATGGQCASLTHENPQRSALSRRSQNSARIDCQDT